MFTIFQLRCFKGCAEWKTSGGGSLFEATEPKGCDCDKVTVANVDVTLSAGNGKIEENRFFSAIAAGIMSFFGDKPQDMSPA